MCLPSVYIKAEQHQFLFAYLYDVAFPNASPLLKVKCAHRGVNSSLQGLTPVEKWAKKKCSKIVHLKVYPF